jgi:hypothetical protein
MSTKLTYFDDEARPLMRRYSWHKNLGYDNVHGLGEIRDALAEAQAAGATSDAQVGWNSPDLYVYWDIPLWKIKES